MNTRTVRWSGGLGVLAMLVAGTVAGCDGGSGGTTTPPTTGTISGTVSSNGSGVSGVQVALAGRGSVSTSASGTFTFSDVPVGTHTVSITVPGELQLSGSETAEKSVTVAGGQTTRVDWALEPRAPTTATVDTVRLSGTTFSPSTLTVKEGSTVVWINTESMVHTVTPDGHSQWTRAQTSSPGEVTRATLNSSGTFDYYCEPHRSAGMTGRIIVQP